MGKGMLGKHHSQETKNKLSNYSKIQKNRNTTGLVIFKKVHTVSREIRQKISDAHKGRTISKEWKDKITKTLKEKGIKPKLRYEVSGEKHHWWKGGITPINKKIRHSLEYKLWRKSVFERDNYTCVWCGDKTSGNLNADHIKQFAFYPELRFAIDNGRTLCIPCHQKTYTFKKQKNA